MKVIESADSNSGERGKEYGIKGIINYIDVSDLDNINSTLTPGYWLILETIKI